MLIVQGVFRSGTTTLFSALRRDPERHCYYEPLHPNLLAHAREATAPHPDHSKSSLYEEYSSVADELPKYFRSDFALRYAILNAQDRAPDLEAYLHLLAQSASRVVLQCNRAFWMTRWLHELFPSSVFVHLVRDPRSVVWSQLTTSSGHRVRMNWPLLGRAFNFSSGNLSSVFSRWAYLGAYHVKEYLALGRRELGPTPEDEVLKWGHDCLVGALEARPYVQALALWGAQTRICHHHGREAFGDRYLLLRYEDLCQSPQNVLQQIYAAIDEPLPSSTCRSRTEHVRRNRRAAWRTVSGAEERFEAGIQEAGIADVMQEFGYEIGPT